MKNLNDLVESAKDFYYTSPLMPVLICAGFYGTIAANGFYRGFNNMPIVPENLSQVTKGDITAVAVAGTFEIAGIIDGLTTDRYSDGARCAAGMVGLPIIGALTHALGYAIGKGVQHIN
jgi:hypothetical protein